MKKSKRFRKKKVRNAEILLTNLAQVLDACTREKLNCKLAHGIIVSRYGFVLPFRGKWVVRMLTDNPYGNTDDDYDD